MTLKIWKNDRLYRKMLHTLIDLCTAIELRQLEKIKKYQIQFKKELAKLTKTSSPDFCNKK